MALSLVTPPRFTITLPEKEARAQAHLFDALASPVRLRILNLLSRYEGQMCVLDIEEGTGLTQPAISHQLKILREAGLVDYYKEKTYTYYSLCKEAFVKAQWALQGIIDPFHTAV